MQNQPTTQPPLFSILMPVYNAAATLEAAARSVLDQSQGDLELLLVDDGSADGSLELARSLAAADPRVRVFAQKNGGICAARNRALAEARGRYLGFCDDDDLYLPGALAAVTALIARTGADLIRTGYELRRQTADGRFVTLPHPAGTPCGLDPAPDGGAYLHFLRQSGPQFVWNAWYRREFFGALCFDGRCRAGLEDFVLNAAVYARGPRAVYDPVVTTRHFESAASTSRASAAAVAARVESLPLWAEAEHAAMAARCEAGARRRVWAARQAELVTFLMHQLRDSAAPRPAARAAWRTLRRALAPLANPAPALDFLRVAGQNKKQAAALLLYAAHLQDLYAHLPNKEEELLT
ncbi:glycosyltransferase family 2 protein [uncultured Subdoligranulum sp.]|uniref:glycosyltransferase family 2 protein n=1 Tax=uncultured Subdoligranulum sp. TaxID=512298 RepID=UPI0025FE3B18|nr:glycosyltransferase family 2 protein [uncultured Subdoligranulum sp.]